MGLKYQSQLSFCRFFTFKYSKELHSALESEEKNANLGEASSGAKQNILLIFFNKAGQKGSYWTCGVKKMFKKR